jgi:hypothetical protein
MEMIFLIEGGRIIMEMMQPRRTPETLKTPVLPSVHETLGMVSQREFVGIDETDLNRPILIISATDEFQRVLAAPSEKALYDFLERTRRGGLMAELAPDFSKVEGPVALRAVPLREDEDAIVALNLFYLLPMQRRSVPLETRPREPGK